MRCRAIKREHPEYSRVEIAGDFRRGCELVSDLALVAQAKEANEIESSSLKLTVSDKKHFGASLLMQRDRPSTSSSWETTQREKGLRAQTRRALSRARKLVASATEEDIYEALGLQFIEPELREGRGEIERAAKAAAARHWLRDQDLHGILHSHTTASDGTETLETMAEAHESAGSNISASPTIRSRHIMRAGSRSRKSRSSTARPTG